MEAQPSTDYASHPIYKEGSPSAEQSASVQQNPAFSDVDVQSFMSEVGERSIIYRGGMVDIRTQEKYFIVEVAFEPAPGKTWNDYDIPARLLEIDTHMMTSVELIVKKKLPIGFCEDSSSGEKKCYVCNFFVLRKLKVVKCSVCETHMILFLKK